MIRENVPTASRENYPNARYDVQVREDTRYRSWRMKVVYFSYPGSLRSCGWPAHRLSKSVCKNSEASWRTGKSHVEVGPGVPTTRGTKARRPLGVEECARPASMGSTQRASRPPAVGSLEGGDAFEGFVFHDGASPD